MDPEEFDQALRERMGEPAPSDPCALSERVMAALQAERDGEAGAPGAIRPAVRPRMRAWGMWAAAAVVLLGVAVVRWLVPGPQPNTRPVERIVVDAAAPIDPTTPLQPEGGDRLLARVDTGTILLTGLSHLDVNDPSMRPHSLWEQ